MIIQLSPRDLEMLNRGVPVCDDSRMRWEIRPPKRAQEKSETPKGE